MKKFIMLSLLCATANFESAHSSAFSAAAAQEEVIDASSEIDAQIETFKSRVRELRESLPSDTDPVTMHHIELRNEIGNIIHQVVSLLLDKDFKEPTEGFKAWIQTAKEEAGGLVKAIMDGESRLIDLWTQSAQLQSDLRNEIDQFNRDIVTKYQRLEKEYSGINAYPPFREIGAQHFKPRGGMDSYWYEGRVKPQLPEGISQETLQRYAAATDSLTRFIETKKSEYSSLTDFFAIQKEIKERKTFDNDGKRREEYKAFCERVVARYQELEREISGINTYEDFRETAKPYFDQSSQGRGTAYVRSQNSADIQERVKRGEALERELNIARREGQFPARRMSGIDPIGSVWCYIKNK